MCWVVVGGEATGVEVKTWSSYCLRKGDIVDDDFENIGLWERVETEIRAAWKGSLIPATLGNHQGDLECADVYQWIGGRDFRDVGSDLGGLESMIPLLCLKGEAAAYYVGSYLLHLNEIIRSDSGGPLLSHFSIIHLLSFLESEVGAGICRRCLNDPQKDCVLKVLAELRCRDVGGEIERLFPKSMSIGLRL